MANFLSMVAMRLPAASDWPSLKKEKISMASLTISPIAASTALTSSFKARL
ncbi:hypothetical protein D3C84_1026290 [compost metagenome]